MSVKIHQSSVRVSLEPRREPYWAAPMEPGRYLGFRKIAGKPGSWIARARTEDHETGQMRQQYRALDVGADDHPAAVKAAQAWFASLDAGVTTNGTYTVEDACREYVEDRRREKGEDTAADAGRRFDMGHRVFQGSAAEIHLSCRRVE